MKKLLTIAFITLTGFLQAQVIPNPGFESWTNYGTYSDPNEWSTLNSAISVVGVTTTASTTDAHSGTTAALLETKSVFGSNVPGILTLADLDVDLFSQTVAISGGMGCTTRPTALQGFYKYLPSASDTAVIFLTLTRYNFENSQEDTLAAGFFLIDATVNTWTSFDIPLEYWSIEEPDTFNVVFISSASAVAQVGTKLYIDDLFLDFSGTFSVDLGPDTTLNPTTTLLLNAAPGSGTYAYEWHKDGDPAILSSDATWLVTEPGTYSVIVFNANGLPAMDTIVVQYLNGFEVPAEGEDWLVNQDLQTGRVWVSWTGQGPRQYLVVNSLGQQVVAGKPVFGMTGFDLPLANLPSGMYYLLLDSPEARKSAPVLIR